MATVGNGQAKCVVAMYWNPGHTVKGKTVDTHTDVDELVVIIPSGRGPVSHKEACPL